MLESIGAQGTSGTLRLLILQDHGSRSPFYWDMTEWQEIDSCSYDEEDLSVLYIEDYWSHLDIVDWCKDHQIPIIKIDELEDQCLSRGWEPMCKDTRALQILQLIAFDAGYEASSFYSGPLSVAY